MTKINHQFQHDQTCHRMDSPASLTALSSALEPSPNAIRLWTPEERLASMNATLRHWQPGQDIWIYAYGSLIWRPEFEYLERRLATLRGHHRSLCLWSRVNRGTPEVPGLVFGLDRGGACRGMVFRIAGDSVQDVFPPLWAREMSTGAYIPRWIHCDTPEGRVQALAFLMDRRNPGYAGDLQHEHMLAVVRRAHGTNGPCVEYVLETASALRAAGIRDMRLENFAQHLLQPH